MQIIIISPLLHVHVAYLNSAAVQHALHIIPDLTSPTVTWSSCSDPVFINWNLMDVYSDTTELYSKIYSKVTTQRANGERSKDFRMLVFSGDTDGICATVGTQHWIYSVTATKDSSSATSSTSSSSSSFLPFSTSSFSSSSSSISTTPSSSSALSSSSSLSEAVSLESIPSLWQPWVIVTNDTDTDINSFTGNVKKRQQGGFLTKFDGSFSFATVHSAGHEVPAFQPVAALSIFAGFLDGSIFSPSVSLTTTQENKNLSIDDSRVIAIVIIVLCSCGLGAVCLLLRSRERKIRRGSCGPPVSTIESGTDAEEDEGRAGPGTLTTLRVASLPTSLAMSSPSKNKYIPMATEEDNH